MTRSERVQRADCWLAQFAPAVACAGRMDRAHLVEQQRLRKEGQGELCPDPRTWRPACRRHHNLFDQYRPGIIVPIEAVPEDLVELLEDVGLGWALEVDRRYLRVPVAKEDQ